MRTTIRHNMDNTIGIAVITHNAKHHLRHCLPPLLNSSLKPRVLVVNSSSNDGTVEEAEKLGAETLIIPREEFNHGTTRELARQALATDIVVMVTPDAYAKESDLIEKLTAPIRKGNASIAYARQLPHHGADPFESFSRTFNYPEQSQLRSIHDLAKYGVYTFFCSNSCCAWKNSALDEIGGFSPVLLGEDTVACAHLLKNGHNIAYVTEAQIHHSHRYTLWQEFQRHFDTGLARKSYQSLFNNAGSDSKRGQAYTKALFSLLYKKHKSLIPYALIQTGVKWMGYQWGKLIFRFPSNFKRKFSSQDFYWS